MMAGYAVFYAAWWPFAWGVAGAVALVAVVVLASAFVLRGLAQIRHAAGYPSEPTAEDRRLDRAMGVLNSVTHPIWLLGAVLLLVFGQGRWVLPLMVFVIGAHFIPMAGILGRRIDYLLGPVAMLGAVAAGVLALDARVSWLVVFAVTGIGGAASTLAYAAYMARANRQLCERAAVPFQAPRRPTDDLHTPAQLTRADPILHAIRA